MILASIRSYLVATVRQWSSILGLVAAVVGYLVNVFGDLKITPLVWIGIYIIGLIVAQFLVYNEQRMRLLAYEAPTPLPQWAMWTHNANADGAWLTLLAVSRPPKEPLGTIEFEELATAAAGHFGFDPDSLGVEPFNNFLRLKFPKTDGTPEFQMQIGTDKFGIIGLQWRTTDAPVSLRWVLDRANQALCFTLTDAARRVLGDPRDRDYSISLGNWPEQGVSTDGLVVARRFSDRHVRGNRVYQQFKLHRRDRDGWKALCAFATAILSDSGHVGFEPSLTALTNQRLTAPVTQELSDPEGNRKAASAPKDR